jgi:hypothetical protein
MDDLPDKLIPSKLEPDNPKLDKPKTNKPDSIDTDRTDPKLHTTEIIRKRKMIFSLIKKI